MRGLYSSKTEIRHKIFTEIARMAYEGQSPEMLEELPYKIVPGEIATYRDSIFLERAVVGERLRVAMGMSLRKVTEHAPISKGVEASAASSAMTHTSALAALSALVPPHTPVTTAIWGMTPETLAMVAFSLAMAVRTSRPSASLAPTEL